MNIENLLKTREALGVEYGFNMQKWHQDDWTGVSHGKQCGTVCCIGGTAARLAGIPRGGIVLDERRTAKWLGLSYPQASALFYPPQFTDRDMNQITIPMAQTAIDNMIEHGEPRWEDAASEVYA